MFFLTMLPFFRIPHSAILQVMLIMSTTHASLLARLRSGQDEDAWKEFCTRYGSLIRGFARRQGLQEADQEEVLQDVLSALTKAMPGFVYDPAKGKFRSYLKTITLRAIFRRTRQNHNEIPLGNMEDAVHRASADPGLDAEWEKEWQEFHLRTAMRVIEVEFGETIVAAFRAYAVDGEDAAETAAALGINVNQVYIAKSRVLKRLSEIIRRQVDEEG